MTTPTNTRSQGGAESAAFIKKTNEEYAAWCKTFYVAEDLDHRGMMSLHGLWAWQEQERRICAALAAPASAQEALRAAIDGLTDYAPHHSGNGMQRGGKYVLRSDVLAALAAIPAPSGAVQQGETLSDEREAFLDHWVKDVPEEYRAAARERAGRDAGAGAGAQGGAELRAVGDDAGSSGAVGGLADTDGGHAGAEREQRSGQQRQQPQDGGAGHGSSGTGPTNGLWRDADWLLCRDGKWRPVEPGTFPLAHGAPARVGRLRAYGNAINAQAARTFIEAVMEVSNV